MRQTTWLGLLGILTASTALIACGGDDDTSGTSTSSSADASSSSTQATSTTTGGGGMGQGGAGGGAGQGGEGGMLELLNGCNETTAEDFTGVDVDIEFPFIGLTYEPPCARVTLGQFIRFVPADSTFAEHPLQGGTVEGGVATPDPTSPIFSTPNDPFVVPFFQKAGVYPYYCTFHFGSGMMGVLYVEN